MKLLDVISEGLGLPQSYLLRLASRASHAYKTYTVPKRTGGHREIHHPARPLKAVQRFLVIEFLNQWPVHDAAMAYRSGRSILDNAARHAESHFLLRVDLASFFNSITANDIDSYLRSRAAGTEDWDNCDRSLFASFVCRWDRLTVGAPTSPALSNALCFDLDTRLETFAAHHRAKYTRYADDLFFSTRTKNLLAAFPREIARQLEELEVPDQLKINNSKTRHSSRRGRRRVTGLTLGSRGEITIGRRRKRFIRRQLHRYEDLSIEERRELAGLLAFARSIEPDLINALILKYGSELLCRARVSS